jgi:hypothetical protein
LHVPSAGSLAILKEVCWFSAGYAHIQLIPPASSAAHDRTHRFAVSQPCCCPCADHGRAPSHPVVIDRRARRPGLSLGSGYSRGGGAFQIAMDLQERAEEIDRENPVPTPTEPRSRLKRSSGGGSGVGDQGLVNRSARCRAAIAVKLFPKTFLSHGNEALLACPGRPRDRRVAAVSTPGKRRPLLARSSLMGQQWPTRTRVWVSDISLPRA